MPKTAELIAADLRRQIVRGELGQGDALPPESALMEQFGVSRPTLREAFRVLESESLITVRRGVHGGARVSAPDPDVAARYAGLILEFRDTTLGDVRLASAVIEPACARILATRPTATTVERLRAALAEEKRAMDDPAALIDAQEAFHSLLVELTGNQTLILLAGIVRYITGHGEASQAAGDTPDQQAQARKGHRAHVRLVGLIEAGKADEAEKLLRRHVTAGDDLGTGSAATALLDLLG